MIKKIGTGNVKDSHSYLDGRYMCIYYSLIFRHKIQSFSCQITGHSPPGAAVWEKDERSQGRLGCGRPEYLASAHTLGSPTVRQEADSNVRSTNGHGKIGHQRS